MFFPAVLDSAVASRLISPSDFHKLANRHVVKNVAAFEMEMCFFYADYPFFGRLSL